METLLPLGNVASCRAANGGIGRRSHGRSRAEGGDEFHETPACAVQALLRVEALPQTLWVPACHGAGAQAAGQTVVASDLRDYGTPDRLPVAGRGLLRHQGQMLAARRDRLVVAVQSHGCSPHRRG